MEKENKNNELNQFREWIDSIPVGMYDEIRLRIINECLINEQKFRHWKAGNSRIPSLAKPIIESIAGKPIFNNK